ncbi:MAG: class I SAM-dependent methyltransferase [Pseudomonadota bacterium]
MTDIRRPYVEGDYYSSPEEKQSFLRKIFDDTAPYYEGIAKWGWFGSGAWYRREALKRHGMQPGMKVVDVASGTGPVGRAILEIIKNSDDLVLCEPSAGMIEESKKTVPAEHHQCTAENLPLEDESRDFLTMGFALRHVDDLDESFREFRRVLKEDGKLLIMDVTVPSNAFGRFWFTLYFRYILPWFTLIFTFNREAYRLMVYYWETMDQMTPRDTVVEILQEAGFRDVEHKVLLGCFSEYSARR